MGVVALAMREGSELEELDLVREAREVLKVLWRDVVKEFVLTVE